MNRWKQIRSDLDLTQQQMADRLGLSSKTSVNRWENQGVMPMAIFRQRMERMHRNWRRENETQ